MLTSVKKGMLEHQDSKHKQFRHRLVSETLPFIARLRSCRLGRQLQTQSHGKR
jgi:hypothetical protein